MNIKQAEMHSGVSRQNIRFYEREGLLKPARNPSNDYREYSDEDIRTLKFIRAMRMLDMPLDQIKGLLEGRLDLSAAVISHRKQLEERTKQLSSAIRFCNELSKAERIDGLNVDDLILRMESPDKKKDLFEAWVNDYRKVVLAEREKVFTFIPDEAVTSPHEFTDALFAYANSHALDLVITKEGMYPEFTINGIEYSAERFYTHVRGIPVAVIRCTVKHPEDFEPDVPEGRKKLMKLLNLSWILFVPMLILVPVILSVGSGQDSWQGWLLLLSFLILAGTGMYRTWLFHFNENGKK